MCRRMGEPKGVAGPVVEPDVSQAVMDAPLRLHAESYGAFVSRLHLQESAAELSVADELRKLHIDPDIFYGSSKRLGISRFDADDVDPVLSPGEAAVATPTPCRAPGIANAGGRGSSCSRGEDPPLPAQDLPPEARWADPVAVAARIPFGPEPPPEFDPLRMREIESHHIETDADGLVRSGALDVLCRLNVPQDDKEETFEEISLEGETRGGRMGRETPRGLGSKLQIDSLTDDEDEFFGSAPPPSPSADGEDAVEPFAIDPSFDYDHVNLTSRCA